MLAAHIAGMPIEEAVMGFGGPLALYLVALTISLRAGRHRMARIGQRLARFGRGAAKTFQSP